MPGQLVTVRWEGRPVQAYLPDPVAGLEPALSGVTIRATEQAAAAAVRMGERAMGLEVAARLLLRSEGLASSAIEGVRATAADVAVAELDQRVGGTAGWVADNLAAVSDALGDHAPLTVDALLAWHCRLMRHSDLGTEHIGRWRDRQGWIGGATPLSAAFVPPPAGVIDGLMNDLLVFANREDLDPVTHAAVVHAQFETIHPFADGNGRIGRLLIGRILKRGLRVAVPPPVSVQFARDIGGYLSGLTRYRQEPADPWVRWFADKVERSATTAGAVFASVADLRARWRDQVSDVRADAAARLLVELLVDHPVLNAAIAADLLGVSGQAARTALGLLGRRGVVTEIIGSPREPGRERFPAKTGRPYRWWAAADLLALLG